MDWCMAGSEEDDSQGGDEEIVEANLLCSVDIRRLVEMR